MSNEVSVLTKSSDAALSLYRQVGDPTEFIEKMGGMLAGCSAAKSITEGRLMILGCMTTGMDIFSFKRQFHIVEGNLTMKADIMLAKLREAGGSFKWIDSAQGDSPEKATIRMFHDGEEFESTYTMKQAAKAELVKSKSNWEKRPGNMLRARAVSEGMKMFRPDIIAGIYTPEEMEDAINEEQAPKNQRASKPAKNDTTAHAPATTATPEAVVTIKPEAEGEIIDAEFQPVEEKSDAPFVATSVTESAEKFTESAAEVEGDIRAEKLKTAISLAAKLGFNEIQLLASAKAKDPEIKELTDLTVEKLVLLNQRLSERLEKPAKK